MATSENVLFAIEQLNLLSLEPGWVNIIWRDQFSESPEDLPDSYDETQSPCELMSEITQLILDWIHSDSICSWESLRDVPTKPLLALLYFYVKNAVLNPRRLESVEQGASAVELYFALIRIPGSKAFTVFQATLFDSCLELFKVHKGGKSSLDDSDEMDEDEDDEISHGGKSNLLKMLLRVLRSFRCLVKSFGFKAHLECLKSSLITLGDLTRLECKDGRGYVALAKEAFMVMRDFCEEEHGRVSETVRLVIHKIVPNLTLNGGTDYPEMAKWNSREQTVIRDAAFSFIRDYIMRIGTDAHHHVKVLIQHLCRQIPDKADQRAKARKNILNLLMLLPEQLYFSMLKWIFREAFSDTVAQRSNALELISQLIYINSTRTLEATNSQDSAAEITNQEATTDELTNHVGCSTSVTAASTNEGQDNSERSIGSSRLLSFSKPVDYVPIEFRRVMLAIIIYRIFDQTATVRCRALTALSEIVSNRNFPTVQALVNAIFIDPYRHLHGEIDFKCSERDFVVEAAMIAGIEEANSKEVSMSLTPGGTRIVLAVLVRCQEEGVFVRKSAISLLVQIFLHNSQWMTKEVLAKFIRHCRDPSTLIRKEMVISVTNLMLKYPDQELLTQLWVEEVVPQVADRDTKVQEQALLVLTQTILQNIKRLDQTRTPTDRLPWQLLTHIAAKRMRSSLTVACQLWKNDKKGQQLTSVRIASILSHIGGPHDSAAWVILAAISEVIDITPAETIMEYYFDVVAANTGNPGIYSLVLITLNNLVEILKPASQQLLQEKLLESLEAETVPANLVPPIVSIATSLMVIRNPDKKQGRDNVAIWAKETATKGEIHLEPCLNPANSTRGSCERCVYLLTLLGSLADIHRDQISRDTFQLVYNFIMDPSKFRKFFRIVCASGQDEDKAIPAYTITLQRYVLRADKSRERLYLKTKGAAIVMLARMGLRNDSDARQLLSGMSTLIRGHMDPVLQINVLESISDLGRKFVFEVEPYVPELTLCLLPNRHRDVRETALLLLIGLLQEDYLKPALNKAFTYHLLSLINDNVPRFVAILKTYFTCTMLPKCMQNFDQLLLKAMFHYNKCYEQQFEMLEVDERERKGFAMSGPGRHRKRLTVYRFLVSCLKEGKDGHKADFYKYVFSTVLLGAERELLRHDKEPGQQVIQDALALLASKEFAISAMDNSKKKDGDEDPDNEVEKVTAADPKSLNAIKEHDRNIENLYIPTCCKLRKIFSNRSLLKKLNFYVRDLVRPRKAEISKLFHSNPQYGEEILHEINTIPKGQEDDDLDLSGSIQTKSPRLSNASARSSRSSSQVQNENSPIHGPEAVADQVISPGKRKSDGTVDSDRVKRMRENDEAYNDVLPPGGEFRVVLEKLSDLQFPSGSSEQEHNEEENLASSSPVDVAPATVSSTDEGGRRILRDRSSRSSSNTEPLPKEDKKVIRKKSTDSDKSAKGSKNPQKTTEALDFEEELSKMDMLPPSRPPSKRVPQTPKIRKAPLFSSTPLVTANTPQVAVSTPLASQSELDGSEISPVVQRSTNSTTSSSM